MVKRKCVNYSYIKSREKLVIMLREYYIRVNKLFVFQYFSNVFKRGSCKIKKGGLGLAERGKVNRKEGVINKVISKKAYKL
jgi:hypothetical protein